jgi:molybdopterin converting factor small subunit
MSAVRVPTPLRPYTEGMKEVDVQAGTVGEALQNLATRYPGVRPHLFDEQGSLRAYVNVFLNDDDVRSLQGQATPLQPSDRLTIVPSIAGGGS